MPKSDLSFPPGDYALVADRIALFYQRFPSGRIVTELIARTEREVVFIARVYRAAEDRHPAATGWAAEREGDGDVNLVACLENTETSAIGRALANLGFTAARRRPSREEMLKADRARERLRAPGGPHPSPVVPGRRAEDAALQRQADVLADVFAALAAAEREGMQPARVERIRALLLGHAVPLATLERVERGLQGWLAARVERRLQAGASGGGVYIGDGSRTGS